MQAFKGPRVAYLLASVAGACLLANGASAQEQPQGTQEQAQPAEESGGLQEIIVTAQKRAENVQDIPIAISAVSGDTLGDRHVTDAEGLARIVPNVTFNNAVGETRIGIRGITFDNVNATAAEARVAYHLDGVYIARSGNINGTIFDVDRVEVVRGPQGTLFGRNAVAGAVNLITRDPTDETGGYINVDVGNYDAIQVEGAVNLPLSDKVALRIAGRSTDHDGYGKNLTNDQDIDNQHQRDFRAKLRLEPTDTLKIILSGDYSRRNDNSGLYFGGYTRPPVTVRGAGLINDGNPRNTYSDTTTKTSLEFYGFSANMNWELGDGFNLTSVTGYRHSREIFRYDFDYTSAPLLSPGFSGDIANQFSQEVRLQKDFDRGHFMIGGFYFYEKYTAGRHIPINRAVLGAPAFTAIGARSGGAQVLKAPAIFAQFAYDVTDSLQVTLGARYSKDRKRKYDEYVLLDLVSPDLPPELSYCDQPCNLPNLPAGAIKAPEKDSWNNFSPRISIQYKIDPDKNLYATYSRGFKSGGFNLGAGTVGFNPEKITDYELGFKADWFDRRLRTNIAAFYYDYTNLQVSQVQATTLIAKLQNAAKAKLYGVEAEVTALPVDGLQLDFSGSLLKSEFTEFLSADPTRPGGPNGDPTEPFDLSGNRLPSAPKYTLSYGAQYTWPTDIGEFTLRGEGYTTSRVYFDQFNVKSVSAEGYTNLNASLKYVTPDGNISVTAYIRNITNHFELSGATVSNGLSGFPVQTTFPQPRTYGIKLGVTF